MRKCGFFTQKTLIFQGFLLANQAGDEFGFFRAKAADFCLRSGLDVAHLKRHCTDDERGRAHGEEDDFGLADLRPRRGLAEDQQPAFEVVRDKKYFVAVKKWNVL